MAKGRMINNKITSDKRINDLSDDTSRLAFTWLITFADIDGRTHGDPSMVRSILFPRRSDITYEQMEFYIKEWAGSNLIIWYEADGDKWIQFTGFDKNQNLRRDREPTSAIPAPPVRANDGVMTELIQQNDGVNPEQIPVKLREVKRSDSDKTDTAAAIFTLYENEIGLLTPLLSDKIGAWIDDYPELWITDAIGEAVIHNVRKPAYIEKILKTWQAEGRTNGKKPYRPEDYATEVYQ